MRPPRSVDAMPWHSFRLAPIYAVPVVTVAGVLTRWPAGLPVAESAIAALVVVCQVVLFRAHRIADRSARLDPLTGLPGRADFVDRMGRALDGRAEVGLVFVDLDHFKAVNDTYGHGAGDRVLVETGCRLRGSAPVGAVVARLGGDEFAVLVPAGPTSVEAVAGRVEAALHRPVRLTDADDAPTVAISASVGTAVSVGGSVGDLLAAADRAMYRAKRTLTDMRTAVPNGETRIALP